jgi:hypothetical protein
VVADDVGFQPRMLPSSEGATAGPAVWFSIPSRGKTREMADSVQVEAARIPDRDRLLQELRDAGVDAYAVDEVCIDVPCGDTDEACDELLALAEDAIMSIGAPFVPIKHDGRIYIRPPLS